MRTILGLCVDPIDGIDSIHGDKTSIQVDEVQETMDGHHVYTGEAAFVGYEAEDDVPKIGEDGEISTMEMSFEKRIHAEWFAVPDASPGFVAIDSSDAEFVFSTLGIQNGGMVSRATYALDGFVDELVDEGATLWQVLWSDSDESGAWYPGSGSRKDITDHALKGHIQQVGFRLRDDGRFVEGTVARSGYCELYSPDMDEAMMADWIRRRLLRHSGVQDIGSADDLANGDVDDEDIEEAREEQLEDDSEEDEAEDGPDAQMQRLDELDSVTVDGGDGE